MRWKLPHDRELQIRTRFAWIPTLMSNDEVVWLERYSEEREYLTSPYDAGWFTRQKWIDNGT